MQVTLCILERVDYGLMRFDMDLHYDKYVVYNDYIVYVNAYSGI